MTNALIEGGGSSVLPTVETPAIQADVDTGFADAVSGTEPQWTLDTDLAELADQVYNAPGEPVGEGGWTRVDPTILADAGILAEPRSGGGDVVLTDPDTGLKAAIYTNDEGHYVVAFAGTDTSPVDGQDILNNVQQGVGLDADQFDQAMALGRRAIEVFGEGNVVFTGHSLGGGLASAASLATGNPAVTFNASGIGAGTWLEIGRPASEAFADAIDGQIRRYNVENDVLTNAQQKSLTLPGGAGINLPDAVGYEITLENPVDVEDPVRAHGSATVVEAMKARDIKSEQGDNLVEQLLERNLFPMGPSVTDLYQSGGDAGRWLGDRGGELIDLGGEAAGVLVETGLEVYADGRELYQDTRAAGEELLEDGLDTLEDGLDTVEDAAQAGTDYLDDRVDDLGGLVSGAKGLFS